MTNLYNHYSAQLKAQCVSIFSVALPFCTGEGEQRHLYFHVDTPRGSTSHTASILIHLDTEEVSQTHIDTQRATGLGGTQKHYSITWWPLKMVPASNLLPLSFPIIHLEWA